MNSAVPSDLLDEIALVFTSAIPTSRIINSCSEYADHIYSIDPSDLVVEDFTDPNNYSFWGHVTPEFYWWLFPNIVALYTKNTDLMHFAFADSLKFFIKRTTLNSRQKRGIKRLIEFVIQNQISSMKYQIADLEFIRQTLA